MESLAVIVMLKAVPAVWVLMVWKTKWSSGPYTVKGANGLVEPRTFGSPLYVALKLYEVPGVIGVYGLELADPDNNGAGLPSSA